MLTVTTIINRQGIPGDKIPLPSVIPFLFLKNSLEMETVNKREKNGGLFPPGSFASLDLFLFSIRRSSYYFQFSIFHLSQLIGADFIGLYSLPERNRAKWNLKQGKFLFNNGSRMSSGFISIHH